MRRAFPDRVAFQDETGKLTETGFTVLEDLKDAIDPKDFEAFEPLEDTATLAEAIAAYNALLAQLKA